ncbi:MAG: sensor histidine kinase [Marinoscillum sp.]
MKFFTLGLLLASLSLASQNAQNQYWEHLDDSPRLDSLISLTDQLLYDDPAECVVISSMVYDLAVKLKDLERQASALQTLGIAQRILGQYDSSFQSQSFALDIWVGIGDSSEIAGAYNNLGIIYDEKGINDKAIEYYLKGLSIYEQIGSQDGMAKAYNNLGIVNKKEGNYEKVLDYYQKSLAIYKELRHSIGETITYGNIGSVYLELEEFEEAIKYSENAIQGYKDLGLDQYVPYSLENIGIAYKGLGDLAKAETFHQRALEQYLKYGNEKEATFTRGSLADILLLHQSYAEAELMAQKCLEDAERMGLLDEELRATRVLYGVSKETGKLRSAIAYHERILSLSDQLSDQQKTKTVEELQVRYETQKKEQAIKTLEAETALNELEIAQTRYLLLTSLVLGFIGIGAIMLINSRKRYKLKAGLAEEKERIQKERFRAVIEAEEKERKRIARELHDGLGQLLSTTRITVSSLEGDEENKKVRNSIQLIDHAVQEVRNISHNMMPNALVSFGLDAALDDMIRKINEAENVQVRISRQEGVHLEESTSIGIYRVLQEIINNALKYAEASAITISIVLQNGFYYFEVTDDGKGFDLNQIKQSSGIGWNNMQSRIELIGGEMTILSKLGHGTTVKFTAPQYD